MTWEESYHRSHTLLREGKYDEACSLLRAESVRARAIGNRADAAFLSNALGSAYAAQRRDAEALDAYLLAERDDPFDIQLKLTTAWHLLWAMNLPEEAQRKAEEALLQAENGDMSIIKARSILGVSHLRQKRVDKAVDELRSIRSIVTTQSVGARGSDLALVEALLAEGVAADECREYLSDVRRKAASEKDESTLARVVEIESRLRG